MRASGCLRANAFRRVRRSEILNVRKSYGVDRSERPIVRRVNADTLITRHDVPIFRKHVMADAPQKTHLVSNSIVSRFPVNDVETPSRAIPRHRKNTAVASARGQPPAAATEGALTQDRKLRDAFRASMALMTQPAVVITSVRDSYKVQEDARVPPSRMKTPSACAMTVSSFTSLALDPNPTVTFNVNVPSTTYDAIVGCGYFNAHILTPDALGAQIAAACSGRHRVNPRGPLKNSVADNTLERSLGVLAALDPVARSRDGDFDDGGFENEASQNEKWPNRTEEGIEPLIKISNVGKVRRQFLEQILPQSDQVYDQQVVYKIRGAGVMRILRCRVVRTIRYPYVNAHRGNAIVIAQIMDIEEPWAEPAVGHGLSLSYGGRAYRGVGEKINMSDETEPQDDGVSSDQVSFDPSQAFQTGHAPIPTNEDLIEMKSAPASSLNKSSRKDSPSRLRYLKRDPARKLEK
ncbi:flavin reductase like domain-containing protein [Xylariaceae sp. FL1019]|nr:flavin reductase like domain-containing protein [Xylariaceae sp. FL1019]